MPDAKNMNLLNRDINTAAELLIAIAFNWPDADKSGLDNLSELAAPLAADIAWARRRVTLGRYVESPPTEATHRRHFVNRSLFEIFRRQRSVPLVLYNRQTGEPELVPRSTAEVRIFYAEELVDLPRPSSIGRPRLHTADEISNLATNAPYTQRRRLGRLKPRAP